MDQQNAGSPAVESDGLPNTVSYGSVHGYLEAYGPRLTEVAAKYEVAATAEGPALISVDVANRAVGAERALFSHVMTIGRLPPGEFG